MVETAASVGSVTQIIGPVLDVEFTEGKLPAIFSAILVKGDEGDIVCEVQQLLGNNRVRAVSMSSTDGLKRGVEAVDTGSPITVPVAPTNLSDFVLRPVEENWAKYLQSDRRISQSGKPTVNEPRFNQHKNFILMHPQNASCPSVDVDYIRKPEVVIDVTNDISNLDLFYSETLLNRLTDEAVKMFYQEVRDPNQYQIADREMIDNP